MAFTNDQVGLERGATQLLLDRSPRVMDRYREGGPQRADIKSIVGSPIGVEYTQTVDDPILILGLEQLTEAQADILRTLMDSPGPVTVKIVTGASTTITCLFTRPEGDALEPVIGDYPENAPSTLRFWRADVRLLKLS